MLRQRAYSAGRWTTASSLLRAAFHFLQMIILARILLPAEFGLMAMIAALLTVISLFADLGLSRALVHYRDIAPSVRSSFYWLNLGASLAVMALLMAAAPLVATLYAEPSLQPLLLLASLSLPLSALGQQFRVLAEKELRFAVLARIEIGAGLIGLLVAVGMALIDAGVYALLGGMLATVVASSAAAWLWLSSGHRPQWHFCFGDTRPYLGFGGYLVGETLASNLHREADIFVGGLVVGPAALGVYSLPRDLSLKIANNVINPVLTRIGFPVMALVQDDRIRLKTIYLGTLQLSASLNFPLYVLLSLFAGEIVAVLYGPRWQDAAVYLQILAVWGLVRSTGNPVDSLLYATGNARIAFWWHIALLVTVPPILWVVVQQAGLLGMAFTMLLVQVLLSLLAWRFLVSTLCGATLREYLWQFVPALVIALVAGAVAWLAVMPITIGWLRLALGAVVLAAIYVLLSWLCNQPWLDAMRHLLRWRQSAVERSQE